MMTAYVISSVGLGLDIIGVVLIWRFGFQQDLMTRGQGIIMDTTGPDPQSPRIGRLALGCLVTGFGLQLAANILQMTSLS
jgi:hypothetical protein